jgi:hypothetical protein
MKTECELLRRLLREHLARMERRYIEAELDGNPVPEDHRDPHYLRVKAALLGEEGGKRKTESVQVMIEVPGELPDAALKAVLEARGWRVTRGDGLGWMRIGELARRLGRRCSSVCGSVAVYLATRRPGLEVEYVVRSVKEARIRTGPERIKQVRPALEFFAWLSKRGGKPVPEELLR